MLISSGRVSFPPDGKLCSVTVSPELTSRMCGVLLSRYPHTMLWGVLLVATRHKWAPAEYRRADGHTRLIPAHWPCGADRREGIAVAEVYFMDSSSRHQSREGPLRQQIRIPGFCIV